MFTAPLVAVMFPKVVQSAVQKQKTNLLFLTLISTAILGAIAATFCTLTCKFMIYALHNPEQVKGFIPEPILQVILKHPEVITSIGTMIPWFVWCMLPLSLANVLLNNLLARMEYRVVSYLIVLVALYATVEVIFGSSFIRVIQILGIFNLLYLIILAIFTKIAKAGIPQNISTILTIS